MKTADQQSGLPEFKLSETADRRIKRRMLLWTSYDAVRDTFRFEPRPLRFAVGAMSVVALLLGSVSAYAYSNDSVTYGHALYSLKLGLENAEMLFAGEEFDAIVAKHASKRLDEAEMLLHKVDSANQASDLQKAETIQAELEAALELFSSGLPVEDLPEPAATGTPDEDVAAKSDQASGAEEISRKMPDQTKTGRRNEEPRNNNASQDENYETRGGNVRMPETVRDMDGGSDDSDDPQPDDRNNRNESGSGKTEDRRATSDGSENRTPDTQTESNDNALPVLADDGNDRNEDRGRQPENAARRNQSEAEEKNDTDPDGVMSELEKRAEELRAEAGKKREAIERIKAERDSGHESRNEPAQAAKNKKK